MEGVKRPHCRDGGSVWARKVCAHVKVNSGGSSGGQRVVEEWLKEEKERIDGTKRVCLRLLLHIVFGSWGG